MRQPGICVDFANSKTRIQKEPPWILLVALEKDPTLASAYYHRGGLQIQERQFSGGIAGLYPGINLGLKDPVLYNNRGKHFLIRTFQ